MLVDYYTFYIATTRENYIKSMGIFTYLFSLFSLRTGIEQNRTNLRKENVQSAQHFAASLNFMLQNAIYFSPKSNPQIYSSARSQTKGSVWPEIKIKSSPNFPNNAQKGGTGLLHKK